MLEGWREKTTSQPSTLGRKGRKGGNGRKGRNGRGLDLLTCTLFTSNQLVISITGFDMYYTNCYCTC
tara:strand:- start:7 stop:207 length:201 start_codon:yes stop_codon:yes gene_type:complete